MNMQSVTRRCLLLVWVLIPLAAWAVKGGLGFAIQAEIEGLFSPTIRKITVSDVQPASPAARAGLVVGDEITAIEGHAVVGANAREMKGYMDFGPGETRTLGLRHANGVVYTARLTKPAE